MNCQDSLLTNAVTSTYNQDENNQIWQPMNSQPRNDSVNTLPREQYQFEPIDQDLSPLARASHHSIQRPVPIHHSQMNVNDQCSKSPSTSHLPSKRNSAIDTNNRSFPLSRSITTDHLASNPRNSSHRTTRLYYCPSVQDVLDALERRATYGKESMV